MSAWVNILYGAAAAAAFVSLSNFLYIHTNEYKKKCGNRIRLFRDLPASGLDGIVIGSSQAFFDFDFPQFGYSIVNLSGNPQPLRECCSIVKENIFRVKKGGVLLVCLPFVGGGFGGYDDDRFYEVYYSVLEDCRTLNGYKRIKHIIYKYLPVLGNWKNFLRIFHDYPTNPVMSENILDINEANKMVEDRIKEWRRLTGVDIRSPVITDEYYRQLKKNMDILKDTFLLCRKYAVNPVIITPPIIDTFYGAISDEFWDDGYNGPLKSLADELHIRFIDICGERRYGGSTQLFQGIDFLNQEGRKKLTGETLARLKGMGLV